MFLKRSPGRKHLQLLQQNYLPLPQFISDN